MCCAIACLVRLILHIVVGILMTIGIVLTILGAVVLWGFEGIMKLITPLRKEISEYLSKLGIQANPSDVINLMSTHAKLVGSLAFALGITLMVFSVAFLIVMCFCTMRLILIVITGLLVALTIGIIIFVSYYGADSTNRIMIPFENFLMNDIILKYEGIKSTKPQSIFINVMQITMQCCGLDGYSDFDKATNFNRTAGSDSGATIHLAFPISCCNYRQDFTISKDELRKCMYEGNSNRKNNGCWSSVKPKVQKFLTACFTTIEITIGVLIAIIVALVIFIFCLGKLP